MSETKTEEKFEVLQCPWCGHQPHWVSRQARLNKSIIQAWVLKCTNDACKMTVETFVRREKENCVKLWNGRKYVKTNG